MTSSTATDARLARRQGFTLVEMLVVIGVIVVVVSILTPAINIAYTHAIRNRMQMDIQAISTALEAYRSDQKNYPQVDYTDTAGIVQAKNPGAVLLCWALMGPGTAPQDGVDGPGFSVVPHGQVYQYLDNTRFKTVLDAGNMPSTEPNVCFADRYMHPILYFRQNPFGDMKTIDGYCSTWNNSSGNKPPMWNAKDNLEAFRHNINGVAETDPLPLQRLRLMIGDQNADGKINVDPAAGAVEKPILMAYLLWSAGPDEVYGIEMDPAKSDLGYYASLVPGCDDATNFKQ